MKHTRGIISIRDSYCQNCAHFYRHFVYSNCRYHLLNVGHCAYPRLKDRLFDETCSHFKEEDKNVPPRTTD